MGQTELNTAEITHNYEKMVAARLANNETLAEVFETRMNREFDMVASKLGELATVQEFPEG